MRVERTDFGRRIAYIAQAIVADHGPEAGSELETLYGPIDALLVARNAERARIAASADYSDEGKRTRVEVLVKKVATDVGAVLDRAAARLKTLGDELASLEGAARLGKRWGKNADGIGGGWQTDPAALVVERTAETREQEREIRELLRQKGKEFLPELRLELMRAIGDGRDPLFVSAVLSEPRAPGLEPLIDAGTRDLAMEMLVQRSSLAPDVNRLRALKDAHGRLLDFARAEFPATFEQRVRANVEAAVAARL